MKERNHLRPQNPFDDDVKERLRRMGLFKSDGATDETALQALSHAFAGLLFDDLCDACQDYEAVQCELRQLWESVEHAEPRRKILLVCLQYDSLSKPLPDPIWWISGNSELAGEFADDFIRHLNTLSNSTEEVSS